MVEQAGMTSLPDRLLAGGLFEKPDIIRPPLNDRTTIVAGSLRGDFGELGKKEIGFFRLGCKNLGC